MPARAEAELAKLKLARELATKLVGGDASNKPVASLITLASWAGVRNNDVEWEEWNVKGMAIWLATNGHERGFEAFDIGSQKSTKYNASRTNEVDGDDASELRFSFAMP